MSGVLIFFLFPALLARAEEPVVVVIDPGHGGDNLGAEYEEYTEKDMTMTVALAMKEELETYDDVVVYLTREGDESMTIKDRALFAKEKNADFLFCLHFNSSVHHQIYGAEVWVSAFGEYYVKGRQFGEISMQLFEEMGLFNRGIKTRLNDSGDNYYGILRYCTQLGVPAALIEHCHLDQENDQPFYQQGEEQLILFGQKDGEAAAKYLGLKSSLTGADYSDYPKVQVALQEVTEPDTTEPEECSITLLDLDESAGTVTVSMSARDSGSYIQYYGYSLDGGETYSQLWGWPRTSWDSSEPEYVFTVELPFEQDIALRAIAYNGYDRTTESNILSIPALSAPSQEQEALAEGEEASAEEENGAEQGETPTGEASSKADYREIVFEAGDTTVIPDGNNGGDTGGETAGQEKLFLIALIVLISLLMALILYALVRMLFRLTGSNRKRR